jgi:hypothetical protein
MQQAEDLKIKKTLGPVLFNLVKTELAKTEPAVKIVNLLPYLRKPVAYYAVAMGIDELGLNVTDKMVFFESQQTTFLNSTIKTTASVDVLASIKNKAAKMGNEYLEDMKAFLLADPTTYPEYTGQHGYPYKTDNTGKKIFVAG